MHEIIMSRGLWKVFKKFILKDKCRVVLNGVWFENGWLMASDGSTAIKTNEYKCSESLNGSYQIKGEKKLDKNTQSIIVESTELVFPDINKIIDGLKSLHYFTYPIESRTTVSAAMIKIYSLSKIAINYKFIERLLPLCEKWKILTGEKEPVYFKCGQAEVLILGFDMMD